VLECAVLHRLSAFTQIMITDLEFLPSNCQMLRSTEHNQAASLRALSLVVLRLAAPARRPLRLQP
jgi:hypothetical protein